MNYKTGLRNKEGEFEGYAKTVNSIAEENATTPLDKLKQMQQDAFVRYNYLKSKYNEVDKGLGNIVAQRNSIGYSTFAPAYNAQATDQEKELKSIYDRLGGTKEVPGEVAQAKAVYDGLSRAYQLNESPENTESSNLHTAAKGFVEGSMIAKNISKALGFEMDVSENERKQATRNIFDEENLQLTNAEKKGLELTIADKFSQGMGSVTGVVTDFAVLELAGGAAGIPRAIAGLESAAKNAEIIGNAYRFKKLKTFAAQSLYEEMKFGAIGGEPGQGTVFSSVGKVLNRIPFMKHQPFGKWYVEVPRNLAKADISMTSTVYSVDAINATADALYNDKEWKYQIEKHFGSDLGEFGERVMTDLMTNWMFGVKETIRLGQMDRAALEAEANYMVGWANKNGLKEEARDIQNMMGDYKAKKVNGDDVLTAIKGTYFFLLLLLIHRLH
jgi:hypothetical protein